MATFRIGQLESELPVKLHWWNEALNAFDDAAHISTSATMVAIGLDSAWLEKLRDSADLVLQASHEAISTATIERPRRIILLHTTAFDWPLRHLLALKVPSHAYLLLDLAQLHFKRQSRSLRLANSARHATSYMSVSAQSSRVSPSLLRRLPVLEAVMTLSRMISLAIFSYCNRTSAFILQRANLWSTAGWAIWCWSAV